MTAPSAVLARKLGYRAAWSDAEHMRLASFRSPGDDSPVVVHGPLPAAEDPWLLPAPDGASDSPGRRAA